MTRCDGTVGPLKAERFLITFRLESSVLKTKTLSSILTRQLEKKLLHVYYVLRLFLIFSFYFIVFYYSSVKISFIHLFIHSLEKETNQKKKKNEKYGEELLGSQARWRVIPRSQALTEPTTLRSGVARLSPLDHLRLC